MVTRRPDREVIVKRRRGKNHRLSCALFVLLALQPAAGCASKEERAGSHLDKAAAYLERHEWDKAVIELRNALQLAPGSDEAYYALGRAYLGQKKGREAFQAFRNAVDVNPDHTGAQLGLGRIFLLGNEVILAREKAELVLEKEPENVEALRLLSGAQVRERDVEAAVASLEKAAAVDPEDAGTHLSLARVYLAVGKNDRAREAYDRVIRLDPQAHEAYVELARVLVAEGEAEPAEALLEEMVRRSDAPHLDLAVLAGFYESRGKWDLAEKAHLRAVDEAPEAETTPRVRLGGFYARQGSYEEAVAAMEGALRIREEDVNLRLGLAEVHLRFDRPDRAEPLVDAVLAEDAGHVAANDLRGRIHMARKEPEKALERLEHVLRNRPDDARANYHKGVALAALGRRDEAAVHLKRAVGSNPRYAKARLLLAEIHLGRREVEPAREQLEAVLRLAPDLTHARLLQVSLLAQEKDWEGAEKACLDLIERHPEHAPARVQLGRVYMVTGRPDEAAGAFRKALELDPARTEALSWLVAGHLARGEYEQALELTGAHRVRVGDAPALQGFLDYLEARVSLARGDLGRCERLLGSAVERNPDMVGVYPLLAMLYARQGRTEEARAQFAALLERDPGSASAHMALGALAEREGRGELAEEHYRKALEIREDFAPAANNLAWRLLTSGGNIDEALKFAQIAKESGPRSPEVMDTLGWVYYHKGLHKSALSELEDALHRAPENPVIRYHAGMAYLGNGQPGLARVHLEKALALDPLFEGADRARAALEEIREP